MADTFVVRRFKRTCAACGHRTRYLRLAFPFGESFYYCADDEACGARVVENHLRYTEHRAQVINASRAAVSVSGGKETHG